MIDEPLFRQEALKNVSVAGDLIIHDIIQTIVTMPPQLEGNPFEPPQIRDGGLFGREEELAQLHELLQSGKNVCVVAGMGGVGKTELVRQYSRSVECRSHFSGGVFYIDTRNRQNIADEIVALTKWKFNRDLPAELSTQQKVTACWDTWKRQTEYVLMIFDDVSGFAEQIKPYLPPRDLETLNLLMTSREIPDKRIAEKLDLKILSLPAAVELLSSIIDVARVEAEREHAELLCKELGCLPLALELVSHYLAEDYQQLSLSDMRDKLQAKVKHPSLSPEQVPMVMSASRGIQAAFDLSWDQLPSEAKHLGCVLGAFASAPIYWDFVTIVHHILNIEISNPDNLKDRWLKSLRKLHLVIDITEDIYDLHPLLRDYFREQLKQHPNQIEIKQAFCTMFAHVAICVEQSSNLATFHLIEPHLKKMLDWSEGEEDTQFAFSLNGLAILYQSQGFYEKAEDLYLRSLTIRENQLGSDYPDVATSLNNLAGLYKLQGYYEQSETFFLRSLAIIECQFGADHYGVATILNNLAGLYKSQGRYSEAETLYLRSIEISKHYLGSNHVYVSTSLNNLALLYQHQGRYNEAESLFLQSLASKKCQLGENHLDVATSLNNLGGLYKSQGRYTEAEPLYLLSLEIKQQQLSENHPEVANTLNNLAGLYTLQERYYEAESLFLNAKEMLEHQLGIDHPDVATSLNNLAELYQCQGRYSEAEAFYLRSKTIIEHQLGIEHPHLASNLNNLAELYKSQGRYSEAEPLYLLSLEMIESQLGTEHPEVATIINNLGGFYESQGRYSEANLLYSKSLKICEEYLGVGHPNTIIVRGNYARCLRYEK